MENTGELNDLEKQKQLLEITMSMEEEKEEKKKEEKMPMLISVIGKDQSGKEKVSDWLKETLGFQVVTVEAQLLQLFQNKHSNQSEFEKAIMSDLAKGQKLDNKQIADLVFSSINQHKQNKAEGLILLDFPQNQEQW